MSTEKKKQKNKNGRTKKKKEKRKVPAEIEGLSCLLVDSNRHASKFKFHRRKKKGKQIFTNKLKEKSGYKHIKP